MRSQKPGVGLRQLLDDRGELLTGGYDRYRAAAADENAWRRGRRPKGCKLANNRWLRRTVARKLESDWSPEQIAGWLKRAYPEDEHYQVSHETIYRSLYVRARGVLKKELIRHLRSKRTMRRPRRAGDKRGQIVDLVSISKRPATVLGRRSVVRIKEQLHRDLGRTADALRDTGEGRQQGYPNRSFRADQASEDDTE